MVVPKTLANFLERKTQLYEQGADVRRISYDHQHGPTLCTMKSLSASLAPDASVAHCVPVAFAALHSLALSNLVSLNLSLEPKYYRPGAIYLLGNLCA